MKKFLMLVTVMSLITILAACGGDDSAKKDDENKDKDKQTEQASKDKVKITDEEKVDKDKVVLKVNDKKVKGKTYNTMYAQTKILMSQNGQDVSNQKKLKEQTLNIIAQQQLLKQDAKKQGIEVSEKEVQSQFKKTKSKNKKRFAAVLEQYHLTEETYKDQLAFELTLRKYIDKELKGTKVTDKEVKEFYNKAKEQQKKLPELEKVKDKVRQQLEKQKEQKQLQAKVKELKKQAEIKHMI